MREKRVQRIGEELRRVISDIIRSKIKDPRIPEIISVTNVIVTNDLSFAKIFVEIMGTKEEKEEAIEGLNSAKGFIKKEISSEVKLRQMPELIFILDETLDINQKMEELIEEVKHGNDKIS
ncbi:30S ribosome-binding factor RbfA [Peptoniphilus sp.]|uniref:30S ribosome-binding factor RbfA n=1 Tax=Peptoniphilus sp. TaxID=1971214 RepID=UPI003994A451